MSIARNSQSRRIRFSPSVLRGVTRALNWLTAPRVLWWCAPLLILGVIVVAIGWRLSLPVVLPGDETYALERVFGLTLHTLTARSAPGDAPTASEAVLWGLAVSLGAVALALVGLALKLLRTRVDRYLLTRARALSLLYADPDAGSTFARLPAADATTVRLESSGESYLDEDLATSLDEAFLSKTLALSAGSVRELLALGMRSEQNLELTRQLLAQRSASERPLHRLFVRIDQRQMRSAMGRDAFGGFAGRAEEVRLTSLPSARCRRLLREQPPSKVRSIGRARRSALIVIGLGDTGFELICRLVSQAQSPALDPLVIVLVDAAAGAIERSLRALSPEIDSVVSLIAISIEARLPESASRLLAALAERELAANCIYLAADEFALVEGWHRELELAYRVQGSGCPLILRVRFATHMPREYSLLAEDDALDAVPRRMHEEYLKRWRASAQPASAATVDWYALPFDYQEENRTSADHYWTKAQALDLLIDSAPSGYQPAIRPETLEALARAEHRRWTASRAIGGWRFGAARHEAAKTHPSMRPWESLGESERQKDRDVVLDIARGLESAGYGLRPLVRLSWRRGNRLPVDDDACARIAAAAVRQARERYPEAAANMAICVDDAASFEFARCVAAKPHVTLTLLVSRSLAAFAVAAGDSTLAAQQLMEQSFEIWVAPEGELEGVLNQWPSLD